MSDAPAVIVFDVNETLSDMSPMAGRFADVGVPGLLAKVWFAGEACGVEPGRMLLTAVHPWDIHGAAHAALCTAWINRTGTAYPGYFTAPDITIPTLGELASILAAAH